MSRALQLGDIVWSKGIHIPQKVRISRNLDAHRHLDFLKLFAINYESAQVSRILKDYLEPNYYLNLSQVCDRLTVT